MRKSKTSAVQSATLQEVHETFSLGASKAPLYHQIACQIEAGIRSGAYPTDSLLPSERELAAQFGVSLITVRGAMRTLIDKGMVGRLPGKGTQVLSRPAAVWELGWLGELVTSVLSSRLQVIRMGAQAAPIWVSRRLGISKGSQVHSMRTVRRAIQRGDQPFMTTDIFHRMSIGAVLKKSDFASSAAQAKLVIATVEEKCGLTIASVRQTMTAELPDEEISNLLEIELGHPLLVVTRDYFDEGGSLIQTSRARYRTDHYEYILDLSRGTARAPAKGHRATQQTWD